MFVLVSFGELETRLQSSQDSYRTALFGFLAEILLPAGSRLASEVSHLRSLVSYLVLVAWMARKCWLPAGHWLSLTTVRTASVRSPHLLVCRVWVVRVRERCASRCVIQRPCAAAQKYIL